MYIYIFIHMRAIKKTKKKHYRTTTPTILNVFKLYSSKNTVDFNGVLHI